MKELGYQRWIVNSVKKNKVGRGYATKLSHQYSVGIPDLLASLPGFAPCLIECKWLGLVSPGFSRKIDLSGKQRMELDRFNNANRDTGWVMVGAMMRNKTYIHQLYHPHVAQAEYGYSACVATATQKELIPLARLFAMIGVRRL